MYFETLAFDKLESYPNIECFSVPKSVNPVKTDTPRLGSLRFLLSLNAPLVTHPNHFILPITQTESLLSSGCNLILYSSFPYEEGVCVSKGVKNRLTDKENWNIIL